MTMLVPVAVAIVGALAYALSTNAKIGEMGRLAFACGLLVALLGAGSASLHLLR